MPLQQKHFSTHNHTVLIKTVKNCGSGLGSSKPMCITEAFALQGLWNIHILFFEMVFQSPSACPLSIQNSNDSAIQNAFHPRCLWQTKPCEIWPRRPGIVVVTHTKLFPQRPVLFLPFLVWSISVDDALLLAWWCGVVCVCVCVWNGLVVSAETRPRTEELGIVLFFPITEFLLPKTIRPTGMKRSQEKLESGTTCWKKALGRTRGRGSAHGAHGNTAEILRRKELVRRRLEEVGNSLFFSFLDLHFFCFFFAFFQAKNKKSKKKKSKKKSKKKANPKSKKKGTWKRTSWTSTGLMGGLHSAWLAWKPTLKPYPAKAAEHRGSPRIPRI